MFMQLLEYLVTNNQNRKKELSEEIKKYGGTTYGLVATLSQIVDTESLHFINSFFNNWNTMSGSKVDETLYYIDKFYRLGFIKFLDRKIVEYALKKVQYEKSHKDALEEFLKDVDREEKERFSSFLSRFNNDELKLLNQNSEVKEYLKSLSEVKKVDRGQENSLIKEVYEKVKKINEAVSNYKTPENCFSCPLYKRTFVGIDYNIADPDKNEFDIIFVGEAPGFEEAKEGKPFVGKSGQFLRKTLINHFSKYNYIITNTCMCHPNKNATPSEKAIFHCNRLLWKIIQIANPKIVVSLGDTSLKGLIGFENYKNFKEKNGGILKNNGKYIRLQSKNFPIVITYHPSYVIRNGAKEESYEPVKKILKKLLEGKEETKKDIILKESLLYYNLPDRILNGKGSILDIQTGKKDVYILYRESGKTEIISFPKINYGYAGNSKKWVEKASNVKPTTNLSEANYETDFSFSNKFMVDWKILREQKGLGYETPNFDWAILDIEVFTENNEFPKPEEAKYPVVLSSVFSSLDNNIHLFILDENSHIEKLEVLGEIFNIIHHTFSDEKSLLLSLMEFLLKHDVITAWNINFDLGYIYGRIKNLEPEESKFKKVFSSIDAEEPYINLEKGIIKIPGKIIVDLLSAYRMFSPGEKESFSLGHISSLELGITKTTAGSNFSRLWRENRRAAVEYNCYDVILCYFLDKKLDILNFLNELRFVSNSSWGEYLYKGTQIDGLLLYYAKKNNMVLHNKYKVQERSYMGGYVYQPLSGRHEIVQFDFSSQYPSIILTLNVGYDTFFGIFSTPNDYKLYYGYLFEGNNSKVSFKFFNQESRTFEERTVSAEELYNIFLQNKITVGANGACFVNHEPSLIKLTVDEVIKKRKHFKKLYSETGESKYNVKQYTYKILANSMYGVIGDSKSRMYMPDIAESITVTGQIANKSVATVVEKYYESLLKGENLDEEKFKEAYLYLLKEGYEYTKDIPGRNTVVYGDTDSIFIKLSEENKNKISNLETSINSILEKFSSLVLRSSDNRLKVELKYYGIIYLTNVKKRYCVYIPDSQELEVKGMEMVKADYPIFFKEKMKELFYLILKENKDYQHILEFIKETEKRAKEIYSAFDRSVGKPVTLQRDEYKSLSPAARGMTLYNTIFGNFFQHKSKGILFQIVPRKENFTEELKKTYMNNLRQLLSEEGKIDPLKEEKNLKWICIPFEDDEVIRENIQKLKEYFIPDFSMIDRYWRDRLREYGII